MIGRGCNAAFCWAKEVFADFAPASGLSVALEPSSKVAVTVEPSLSLGIWEIALNLFAILKHASSVRVSSSEKHQVPSLNESLTCTNLSNNRALNADLEVGFSFEDGAFDTWVEGLSTYRGRHR